jgi:hypothetical protein
MRWIAATVIFATVAAQSDEWKKVAFVGNAKVKSISGLVEVIQPEQRTLREGEMARPGDILRIWRGADLILQMESSKGLVRAKGPVLLRLLPDESYSRAAVIPPKKEPVGFVVRAVHGPGGRYSADGQRWANLSAGMILPEGARVRAFRDSILDFYHNEAKFALRVSDSKKPVTLTVHSTPTAEAVLAAKAP